MEVQASRRSSTTITQIITVYGGFRCIIVYIRSNWNITIIILMVNMTDNIQIIDQTDIYNQE